MTYDVWNSFADGWRVDELCVLRKRYVEKLVLFFVLLGMIRGMLRQLYSRLKFHSCQLLKVKMREILSV